MKNLPDIFQIDASWAEKLNFISNDANCNGAVGVLEVNTCIPGYLYNKNEFIWQPTITVRKFYKLDIIFDFNASSWVSFNI